MARAYLGIGSNIGNRKSNIRKALLLLQQNQITILKKSHLFETEPVGGPPQRKFLNAALEIQTSLVPRNLLALLKTIETKLGRKKTIKNGPRPIDLDILLYEKRRIRQRGLIVPHPRMLERSFVMEPLKEIAPQVVHRLLKE